MTSTPWNGNSRGGGAQNKSALRGGNGYFLELHISCSRFLCPHFTLKIFLKCYQAKFKILRKYKNKLLTSGSYEMSNSYLNFDIS